MTRFKWGVCGMQELLKACWDGLFFRLLRSARVSRHVSPYWQALDACLSESHPGSVCHQHCITMHSQEICNGKQAATQ